jgi:type II secretory pathway pseudopilin PulG
VHVGKIVNRPNHTRRVFRDNGYAMAVLLVGIAIMSVMLGVAMPVWRTMVQREKEEELIFRGNQYARAIGLFQRKYPGGFPANVDFLVQQKFLRKKYKDPMVADGQFQLVPAGAIGQAGQGPTGQAGQALGAMRGQSGMLLQSPNSATGGSGSGFGASGGRSGSGTGIGSSSLSGTTYMGPIAGVVSKSTEKSIRLYNGKDHYNQWLFVYNAGANARGPGGRGMPGRGRGQQGIGGDSMGPGGRGRGLGGGGSYGQPQPPRGRGF